MLRTRLAVFPVLLFSYIKIAGQKIKTKTAFKICFNIFLIFLAKVEVEFELLVAVGSK